MLKLTAKRTKVFSVPQDPTGETTVEIVHLKPGEVAAIEAQCNSVVGKTNDAGFQTEIEFKLNERTKQYVLKSVVDFTGFCGIDDKPLKCTEKHKLSVLKEFAWFGEFVEECREKLAEEVEADLEGAEEN